MTMADRIKTLRLSHDLTQEQLGEKIGVQKSAIRKYESGHVENIKRSSIEKLADIFGVSPGYLMFGEIDRQSNTPSELRLLSLYNDLNEEGQEKLLDYADDLVSSGKYG